MLQLSTIQTVFSVKYVSQLTYPANGERALVRSLSPRPSQMVLLPVQVGALDVITREPPGGSELPSDFSVGLDAVRAD